MKNSWCLLVACLAIAGPEVGCKSRTDSAEAESHTEQTAAEAETEQTQTTAIEETPQAEAPSFDVVTSSATSPYANNPVSWRYLVVEYENEVATRDFLVRMTTTTEREVIPQVGLALRLVGEVEGPGGISAAAGHDITSLYQSRLALLTPGGLTLTAGNPIVDGRSPELGEAQLLLGELAPTWPLPGTAGCTGQSGDFELPIGRVHGFFTGCQNIQTDVGIANVTTIWVDSVGFVYRETTALQDGAPTMRDFLLSSDVAELAEPSHSVSPEQFLPPPTSLP